jgi:hypothetical protein
LTEWLSPHVRIPITDAYRQAIKRLAYPSLQSQRTATARLVGDWSAVTLCLYPHHLPPAQPSSCAIERLAYSFRGAGRPPLQCWWVTDRYPTLVLLSHRQHSRMFAG